MEAAIAIAGSGNPGGVSAMTWNLSFNMEISEFFIKCSGYNKVSPDRSPLPEGTFSSCLTGSTATGSATTSSAATIHFPEITRNYKNRDCKSY
jgi:hypothetical protein